jgi:hypothetical protein
MNLRQEIDGLMISWIEKDGHYALNPKSLEDLEALILKEKRAAVEEFEKTLLVSLSLHDLYKVSPLTKVIYDSMFPPS